MCRRNLCPVTRTKKAWHFFAFIGTFEVFDYLYLPITTSKAHAIRRERRRFTLGDSLKVSKFQSIQCKSYFAFSFSMVCITELCGFAHRRTVSLLLISSFKISVQRYNFLSKANGAKNHSTTFAKLFYFCRFMKPS